jgi:uncharacterized protein
VILELFYELRARKVPVGTQELLALCEALGKGLHDSSFTGFYHVARALLVHSEAHFDGFDQSFAKVFGGVEALAVQLHDELMKWLQDPVQMAALTPEQLAAMRAMDLTELLRLFEERLAEQRERHDGGGRFIGTGGTSPFGHGGLHQSGMRVGGSSRGKSAMKVAADRQYRAYRKDLVLDVRQFGVALRKLRELARDGLETELDLDETIDATGRNAGDLELRFRRPRRPGVRVLLLMDVGGSMDPHTQLVSLLFSAASKASHFKEMRALYFHNCVYGKVYRDAMLTRPVPLTDLFKQTTRDTKLVVVGDALMNPAELLRVGGSIHYGDFNEVEGVVWMRRLAEQYRRSAWLNPEPPVYWRQGTAEILSKLFQMFPLTLQGIEDASTHLVAGRTRWSQ